MESIHIPVLLREIADNLIDAEWGMFVDATVGGGGHAYTILERFETLNLVGIDVDEDALAIAEERLRIFGNRVTLIKGNFGDLEKILLKAGITSIDGILFDLGLSMFQIAGKRGFSFNDEAFLDMRMDRDNPVTAFDVVNSYSYEELLRIISVFGEEPKAYKIARAITQQRKKGPIRTAKDLSGIVARTKRGGYRLNPATKTFQAIRMEVNRETENIERGIPQAIGLLADQGKIGVISFHSIEERMIKNIFKNEPSLEVCTKKPITPTRDEIKKNPKARSAKLRIAAKRAQV